MNIKEGDMFKKSSDGVDFAVKKILNNMAVLESQDRKRQILTEVNILKLKSFYLKKEHGDLWNKTFNCPFRHPISKYPSDETEEGGWSYDDQKVDKQHEKRT